MLGSTTLAISYDCKAGMPSSSAGFSASSGTLTLFVDSPGIGTGVITYQLP